MCSEVYVPEVSRALALQGAELIFIPAGDDKHNLWETVADPDLGSGRSRNLAVVATTQNVYGAERGLAMVATPEEILFEIDRRRPTTLRSTSTRQEVGAGSTARDPRSGKGSKRGC